MNKNEQPIRWMEAKPNRYIKRVGTASGHVLSEALERLVGNS